MRRFALIVTTSALLAGSLGIVPATAAESSGSEPTASAADPVAETLPVAPESVDLTPRASEPIQGTPAEILQETPVTAPLTVGYEAGLFLPVGSMMEKDKRGCTLRNQLLIKIATKKPKVGKKCKLTGGEWLVDFGTKTLTKASQVKLDTLLPDKFVYAQGAYGWTEEQRRIYAENYAPNKSAAKQTRSSVGPWLSNSTVQGYSKPGQSIIAQIHKNITPINNAPGTRQPDAGEKNLELELLRARNPKLFDGWTVATLLNAKSWGLSLTPFTSGNFQVTIEECSKDEPKKGEQNPCSTTYSVPNEAEKYNITAVPMSASIKPQLITYDAPTNTSRETFGYGTPQGSPIDRSLFGIHAPANWVSDIASGFEGPTDPATIPDVPVGYVRLWDTETTWADIEPSKGTFDFRKLDRQIQTAQVLDAKVMLVLGGTPEWAGNGSRQSPPNNIQDWRDYVREIACRYGPSISAYEVWNEANLQTFWTGTPEQMADLTAAAFEEIRGCENSNALVVAANTTSRATGSFGTFYPAYLQALKARNWPVDAYSVHSYPTASGGADDRIRGIGQFRTMLALAGAPQTTVFDTEINYGLEGLGEGHVNHTGESAMTLISRTYIDSVRYGFGSTFWFVWTANPDSKFGIQLTPNTEAEKIAWRGTYDWIVGAQFQRCFESRDKITVCQFNKGADNFSILWYGDVGSAPITIPMNTLGDLGSRKCDLYGNCNEMTVASNLTVGPMPIRIDGPALPFEFVTPEDPGQTETDDVTEVAVLAPPVITDLAMVYSGSNKADAVATWESPTNAAAFQLTGYDYEWRYCPAQECERISGGSTGPGTFKAAADLRKGPGNYVFFVRARGTLTAEDGTVTNVVTAYSSESFELLSSRAAPPSDVALTIDGKNIDIEWTAPNIRKSLIDSYQVQVRNVSTNGKWIDLQDTKKTKASTTVTKLKLRQGHLAQARVRTVLADDVKSRYMASNQFSNGTLQSPEVTTFRDLTSIVTNIQLDPTKPLMGISALPGVDVTFDQYPDAGFEVRASVNGGADWQVITDYQFFEPTKADGLEFAPYDASVAFVFPLPDGVSLSDIQWEIRAVDQPQEGRSAIPPSPWVPLVARPTVSNPGNYSPTGPPSVFDASGQGSPGSSGNEVAGEVEGTLVPGGLDTGLVRPQPSGLTPGEVPDLVIM